MKKFFNVLLIVALVYFTAGGGCGRNVRAANAMPTDLYWFVVADDIEPYMQNITPVIGSAMPKDNFVIVFDIVAIEAGGYIPTPVITSVVGTMTIIETALTDGREGINYSIKVDGLTDGQKVQMSVED